MSYRGLTESEVAALEARGCKASSWDGVEVTVQREFPYSGSTVSGWWDVPVPAYLEDRRARYLAERAGEQPAPEGARRGPRLD